jgi:hypothetical protein
MRMVVRLSAFQGRLQALVDHGSLVRDHNEVGGGMLRRYRYRRVASWYRRWSLVSSPLLPDTPVMPLDRPPVMHGQFCLYTTHAPTHCVCNVMPQVTIHFLAAIFQHLHLQARLRLAAEASEQRRQQRLFDFSQLPQQAQQSQQWQSQQAQQAYASQSSVYQLPPTQMQQYRQQNPQQQLQRQLHPQLYPQPSWQAASPPAGACPTTPGQQLQSQDSW